MSCSGFRRSAPATSTSARRSGRARASAASSAWTSRICSARASAAGSSGSSLMRVTRIDLPFPTAGTMIQLGLSQSGGLLGGSGNFQRADLEGHFYAPIGTLGNPVSSPVKFVLGFSTRSGFVFGNSPFFEQLFTLGGTQFFIPLRGYDEGSITPFGYDPNASTQINPNAFGKAFFSMTGQR